MNYETPLEAEAPPGDDDGLPEKAAKRRRVAIIALAAVAVIALVIWLMHGEDAGLAEPDTSQLPVVSVIAPGSSTVTGTIEATGTLAARREMPVGSVGEGGRVVSVPVDAGEWVGQGQVLAVIDRAVQSQEIAGQAAQVQVARADAALAQANLDRGLKLVDRGFISKADIDRLRATRDAAAARVRAALASLGELQARTARLDIRAPAAGLLLTRNVEPGQVVSGGTGVLFSIARGGELELQAKVSEEDLGSLSVGVPADVTPVGTEKSFAGQIWQLSPTIDEKTRQGTARIALSYAPELRPGGFASASIRSGSVAAPMLPESAILNDEQGSFVFVVGKEDKVIRRSVKTGIVTEGGIAIREGLSGNERVVLRAGGFLSAGDRIKPRLVKPGGR